MIARVAFKDFETIGEWEQLHATAKELVHWSARFVWPRILMQPYLVVTDIWYPGRSGVHAAWRAVDGSARDFKTGKLLAKSRCREAEKEINRLWIYDTKRPAMKCCWYHKVVGGEWHFHLQVHPRTRFALASAPGVTV
jgi:hypothetical protein